MKRKVTLIIWVGLWLLFSLAHSATYDEITDVALGKWGYINAGGKLILPYRYFNAVVFSEGLAGVQLERGGLWGFIDKTGKFVIEPVFTDVYKFSEGLAAVMLPDQFGYGYINTKGQLVIKPQFRRPSLF